MQRRQMQTIKKIPLKLWLRLLWTRAAKILIISLMIKICKPLMKMKFKLKIQVKKRESSHSHNPSSNQFKNRKLVQVTVALNFNQV
jgi:hypothetical protein